MVKKILVVEDDITTLNLVKHILEKNQYHPISTQYGSEALDYISSKKIHGAILDLSLPDTNGLDILKEIRKHPTLNDIPIIILTSNDDKVDTIVALEMGADDYITKPFHKRELIARLNVGIRRYSSNHNLQQSKLKIGRIEIDFENREVKISDKKVSLTFAEFELLALLSSNPGRVFSRDEILTKLWGDSYIVETRIVDMHISSLRKKLDDNKTNNQLIETVRGVGYRLRKV